MVCTTENLDTAWLAGFFDGEGCISIYRGHARNGFSIGLSITAVNTGKEAIEKVREVAGLGSVACWHRDGRQPLWVWRAHSQQAVEVLRKMLPYLVVKRREAEIAVQCPWPGRVRDGKSGRMVSCSSLMRIGQLAAWQALRKVAHGRYAGLEIG